MKFWKWTWEDQALLIIWLAIFAFSIYVAVTVCG